jgi:hypothetical protein
MRLSEPRLLILLAILGATSAPAQSPPLDGSPAFFSGDWIGTGTRDDFCFIRLHPDGRGTVLLMGAGGDWLGARIRWRNERQSLVVLAVQPLPNDPHRRLAPLDQLSLGTGFGTTIHLRLDKQGSPVCELQRRTMVQQNVSAAELLLDDPADHAGSHGKTRLR